MGSQEGRDFLLQLIEERKAKSSTYNVYAAALRFYTARRSIVPKRSRGLAG
jgi:hypothetical protein